MDFFNSVILSKANLINNLKEIKRNCENKKICVMVKANAYNHNLRFTVLNLKNYVDFFGVSNTEEALKVRAITFKSKILLCGVYNKSKLKELIENEISLTVFNINMIKEVLYVCRKHGLKAHIHIKLNTGMNRFGIKSKSYLKSVYLFIQKNLNYLHLEGVYSHLFSANNENLCKMQYLKFADLLSVFDNLKNILIHLENSQGLFSDMDFMNICSMVRTGIAIYGLEIKNKNIRPVLSLISKVVAIQSLDDEEFIGYGKNVFENVNKVAILPIGYADGITKNYANQYVCINNNYAKILSVCMDVIIVDVSNINVEIGDVAEIISNDKTKLNSIENLSKNLNIISYELATNLHYNRLNILEKE